MAYRFQVNQTTCINCGICMDLFPDVVSADRLPLTSGFAAVMLFAVLLIKLMGDPDHNLRDFRIVTCLLAVGALFYFVPYLFGVMFDQVVGSGQLLTVSQFLVSNINTTWAGHDANFSGREFLNGIQLYMHDRFSFLCFLGASGTYFVEL